MTEYAIRSDFMEDDFFKDLPWKNTHKVWLCGEKYSRCNIDFNADINFDSFETKSKKLRDVQQRAKGNNFCK